MYDSRRRVMIKSIFIAALLLIAVPAYSGWFDDTLKNVGESLGNRAAQELSLIHI